MYCYRRGFLLQISYFTKRCMLTFVIQSFLLYHVYFGIVLYFTLAVRLVFLFSHCKHFSLGVLHHSSVYFKIYSSNECSCINCNFVSTKIGSWNLELHLSFSLNSYCKQQKGLNIYDIKVEHIQSHIQSKGRNFFIEI